MRKQFIILTYLILILSGCSKTSKENLKPEEGDKKLIEVRSSYQTYSYGKLGTLKFDWEFWKFNEKGQLENSKTYLNLEYDDRLLIPYSRKYTFNVDGTIKEMEENSLTSTLIYRYTYDATKKVIKKETWNQSGLSSTESYTYNNDVLVESKSSSIIVYQYNNQGKLSSEEYFKDENRTPWFKYLYEWDSKGNETKKTKVNLDKDNTVVLNEATYEYNSSGLISKEQSRKGVLGNEYLISYEYNNKGQLISKQVKRKSFEGYDDRMFITYEYLYK